MSKKTRKKQLTAAALTAAFAFSCLATPAFALEYTYQGDAPGSTFYQSTSTDENYIADNGQIVVGTDGTVSSGTTGNQTSSPLTVLDLPVGEYPEAYGTQTDIEIAMNSVFPNELGPTTENSNCYVPTFIPIVQSGAIPTGNSYLPAATVPSGYALNSYGLSAYYGNAVNYGNGAYAGLPTNRVSMPTITKGGAIGKLSIPSLGVNQYVYEGTSTRNMKRGIAHFDCTSGWLGNIALAGHNRGSNPVFGKLRNLVGGELIYYTTAYGTATYQVSYITTCATTDTSGLQQDGANKLTMYTCKKNQPNVKLCVVATMVGTNK